MNTHKRESATCMPAAICPRPAIVCWSDSNSLKSPIGILQPFGVVARTSPSGQYRPLSPLTNFYSCAAVGSGLALPISAINFRANNRCCIAFHFGFLSRSFSLRPAIINLSHSCSINIAIAANRFVRQSRQMSIFPVRTPLLAPFRRKASHAPDCETRSSGAWRSGACSVAAPRAFRRGPFSRAALR